MTYEVEDDHDEDHDNDDSGDDNYITIDGMTYEVEDDHDEDHDNDDSDDDNYITINGVVYEVENDHDGDQDHYADSDDSYVTINGMTYEVEGESTLDNDDYISVGRSQALSSATIAHDHDDYALARLYMTVFDRSPDAEGFKFWQKEMDEKFDLDDVSERFIDSGEFRSKYEGLDHRGFVAKVYNNVMDRQADESGLNWWTAQLEEGKFDRTDVILRFSDSAEFINSTETVIDEFLGTMIPEDNSLSIFG